MARAVYAHARRRPPRGLGEEDTGRSSGGAALFPVLTLPVSHGPKRQVGVQADNPWLWDHMAEYTRRMAGMFHAFRIGKRAVAAVSEGSGAWGATKGSP